VTLPPMPIQALAPQVPNISAAVILNEVRHADGVEGPTFQPKRLVAGMVSNSGPRGNGGEILFNPRIELPSFPAANIRSPKMHPFRRESGA